MDSQHKEFEAFRRFFSTFNTSRPISSVADLSEGGVFFEILSIVDDDYFRQPSTQPPDNWVIRFSILKRLYRLMTQYFTDVLQKPTSGLDVPDLQALAKDYSITPALGMCHLLIAIGVQCEKNKEFIDKIQRLSQSDQHHLMRAIEQVMAQNMASSNRLEVEETVTEDDHFYMIQIQRSQIFSEKLSLEKAYQTLLEEHRTLQVSYDEVISDKDETLARLREMRKIEESRQNEKSDVILRAEIERLRADLQKSEDNLALAESEIDKQTKLTAELTRKIDDLQIIAGEAARLKDQVDEYRHAADKLQKTENVMEKYKKKLQESADLRQRLKALENQNAGLVDKNASLEEEFRKIAAFKPLLESYKNQIADLEAKSTARIQDIDNLKFELEQSRTKLRITMEERTKDSETLELYQERVRELELMSHSRLTTTKSSHIVDNDSIKADGEEDTPSNKRAVSTEVEADPDDHAELGLGGELDDAITGTTMTDLKIQIKKLERELEAVRKKEADASRVLVLENLLEDANRMKSRYESDYLSAHREKLVLQKNLEDIRSGKSFGDGAETAIALRLRLNETVEQFEELRKSHAELEVKFEVQRNELIIAKSDLNLINKDQLEILATLRESVNEDKVALEADIERLNKINKELNDKNRMQLEQINALLFEKVNLQSEGIGQREKMLQRERDWGALRITDLEQQHPKDVKARLLELQEENVSLKEANKNYQEKLIKARQFIKQQDKLFKDQHTANVNIGTFQESEGSLRAQVKVLESDIARYKVLDIILCRPIPTRTRTLTQFYTRLGHEDNETPSGTPYSASADRFIELAERATKNGGARTQAVVTTSVLVDPLFVTFQFCTTCGCDFHMSDTQVIDGSVLEGGGQILRNSVALATLLRKTIVVENIRKGRTPPGLKKQHRTGLDLASKIGSAELIDAFDASTRVMFKPTNQAMQCAGRSYVANTTTAGSTVLLLQIALPILLFTPYLDVSDETGAAKTTLVLRGGTNAEQAPQIDYTLHVFLPFLQKHFLPNATDNQSVIVQAQLERRGYYPKGGGAFNIQIAPLPSGIPLRPIRLLKRGRLLSIHGIAHYADLPNSVGIGMVRGAMDQLKRARIIIIADAMDPEIDKDNTLEEEAVRVEYRREPRLTTAGAGSGIVLWAVLEGGVLLGGSAVGRKGLDPVTVGALAAEELVISLKSRSCVDEWLQDQIIIYMALAQGESEVCCGAQAITLHTQSAIWVAEQMTGAKFEVSQSETGMNRIRCNGIGFTSQNSSIG